MIRLEDVPRPVRMLAQYTTRRYVPWFQRAPRGAGRWLILAVLLVLAGWAQR